MELRLHYFWKIVQKSSIKDFYATGTPFTTYCSCSSWGYVMRPSWGYVYWGTNSQWVGLREHLRLKPWVLPSFIFFGFSTDFRFRYVSMFSSVCSAAIEVFGWPCWIHKLAQFGVHMFWSVVAEKNPSEKYDGVSWDDDIPKIWKVIKKMFEITNQCCISQKPMAYFKTKKCMIHKSGSLLIFFATINIGLMAPGRNV